MKHYLNETVAFIADIHTITKIKVREKKIFFSVLFKSLYFNRVQ